MNDDGSFDSCICARVKLTCVVNLTCTKYIVGILYLRQRYDDDLSLKGQISSNTCNKMKNIFLKCNTNNVEVMDESLIE